jgi:hypothetical protein
MTVIAKKWQAPKNKPRRVDRTRQKCLSRSVVFVSGRGAALIV